jgi:hypothetical protein
MMIGTNDIATSGGLNFSPEQVLAYVKSIVTRIHARSPQTKVYLYSILKNNTSNRVEATWLKTNELVKAFAKAIEENKKPVRPKRPPKTEEEKRDLAEIEAIMRDMRDPTTTPEFTIDFLIEDIELNGQTYVELLANTIADRKNLATDENKPLIVAAINKVVEGILKVRESI